MDGLDIGEFVEIEAQLSKLNKTIEKNIKERE
jgi:hypothetical protein